MKTALPLRAGVGASTVQLTAGDWPTVLAFLVSRFPDISADTWRARMERGLVFAQDGTRVTPHTAFRVGANIHYYREVAEEVPIPFAASVVFRDEHLLIADKPHFLPVTPTGRYVQECLLARLKQESGLADLVPLHRIDRGTAGLVAFSLNPETRGRYQALFPRREVIKEYAALAPHLPLLEFPLIRRSRIIEGEPFFRMQEVAGVANSETRIEIAERRGDLTLYRLWPLTGRKHQLRVHLAAMGAAILNDPLYPGLQAQADDDYSRPLQLLARALEFDDPISGVRRRFVSTRELQSR